MRDRLKNELENFDNYKSMPPNLKNYRYADDSMFGKVDNFQFRDCLVNKISFIRNQKGFKKRAKSAKWFLYIYIIKWVCPN